ncbi:MAG: hypothetical protein QGI08_05535 [Paracoccaceae bacterium]|jgi:hypothetical protein|nr:hypothetical protein [Paracoccaceae bacterium]MDP7185167.1 hypothetical protein [Paracoccaceae bacterium]
MLIKEISQLRAWKRRNYLDNSPQIVKENVFKRYGIEGAQWVETGTFRGTTTEFLAANYKFVYSIEPEPSLFAKAQRKFANANVELINDVSENALKDLLPRLNGDVNFWLDGHYSAGVTFKGQKECPVEDELMAIETNLANFEKVVVLIDDVRCFYPAEENDGSYPSIDFLVDWARAHNFQWRIEHDIFIMKNHSL